MFQSTTIADLKAEFKQFSKQCKTKKARSQLLAELELFLLAEPKPVEVESKPAIAVPVGEVSLNDGQALAFDRLKKFVRSPIGFGFPEYLSVDGYSFPVTKDQWFRLNGYAGTGKSFLISRFILWLKRNEIRFCVASPTHKALKNIVKMLTAIGLRQDVDYKAVTLTKLLGKVATLDEESGKEVFAKDGDRDIDLSVYQVLLIDEYSMVNLENLSDLCEEISVGNTKVIAVGDLAQLPPVKEAITAIAHIDCQQSTLSEIVRYDGDIARVAEEIRSNDKYKERCYRFQTTTDQTIHLLPTPMWINQAVELFKSDEWEADPDFCRVIAWRNKTVATYNSVIRKRIHGNDVPFLIVGDRLVARRPIFRESPLEPGELVILADNREEFVITEEPIPNVHRFYGWEFYEVPVVTELDLPLTLKILSPNSETLRDARLKELAEEAKELGRNGDRDEAANKWQTYHSLSKQFDNVSHALCLTAHSAQGSTLDHVFLYASEMRWCSEKQQILYTALTRARQKCWVCQ